VNCVGIIPIGSLVVLDSEELAVVHKPAINKSDAERPLVKVIADRNGMPIENGEELDLTKKDDVGNYRRNIIRLVDTTEYNFDTSRYFV
jgi:hypothetical protein